MPLGPASRWFRYRLRTLLLLVTVLCVVLGYWHERAYKQREAVAVARKYSLTIYYRHQIGADGNLLRKWQAAQPPWPRWLMDSLGEDYFVTVMRLKIEPNRDTAGPRADQMTDEEYATLAQLDSLMWLQFHDVPLEDRHLLAWKGLKNLETLSLINTRVTDRSVEAISPCAHLKILQIMNMRRLRVTAEIPRGAFSDQGLARLQHLTGLEWLFLGNMRISDASSSSLRCFTNLTVLSLLGTDITDASLPVIAQLPALECLFLGNTQVTDAGIRELSGLTHLQNLYIQDTAVTDAGLQSLYGLPALKSVYAKGAAITPAGSAKFQDATKATVK